MRSNGYLPITLETLIQGNRPVEFELNYTQRTVRYGQLCVKQR